MRAPPAPIVWALGAFPVAWAGPAAAQPAESVDVSGSCPDSAAISAVLSGLLPPDGLARSPGRPSVADRGPSYLVAVGDRRKIYSDPGRDCAQRARVAAAFISLALVPESPPESLPESLPETPKGPPTEATLPLPPSPAPRLQPATGHPLRVRVDAQATADAAPSGGLFAPGFEAGISLFSGRLGGRLSCGAAMGAAVGSGAAGDVVLDRFPCALGPLVRLAPTDSAVDLTVELDLVAGGLRARGNGFASDYDALRLEVGTRLAIDVYLRLAPRSELAVVVGLNATYEPTTYDLDVVARGVVGQTPSLWAGASAGLAWGIP